MLYTAFHRRFMLPLASFHLAFSQVTESGPVSRFIVICAKLVLIPQFLINFLISSCSGHSVDLFSIRGRNFKTKMSCFVSGKNCCPQSIVGLATLNVIPDTHCARPKSSLLKKGFSR
ncbi:hypothetical protein NPIL_658501 [Nephila pilipes]|uniref:Secreted protein n=1 Tax=Nephila pilipes TaxID=299642 RepID=A0A8X6UUP3_NEPPI|nr:hypothetical protein NPIL_658501 [Nephila pilipes]